MKKASARFAVGSFLAILACLPIAVLASPRAQTAPPPATKKVWDNDDLEGLRTTSVISVAGTTRPSGPQNQSGKSSTDEQAKAKRYRQQLQPLYAQLPKIDAEIAKMKSFEDGSYKAPASSGLPAYNAGRPLNPPDRINQLQKQRSEVVARIGDIEDQARHEGVLPGDLR
jgi:hypothetical protein